MKRLIGASLALIFITSLFTVFSLNGSAYEYTVSALSDKNGNYSGPLKDAFGRSQEEAVRHFKENFYIANWVPCLNTEKDVKAMAENGIQVTFIWDFSYRKPQKVQELLWCMKYGIKVILIDDEVAKGEYNENDKRTAEEYKAVIKPSVGNPYVLGYYLIDEPPELYENEVLKTFVGNFKKAAEGTPLIPFVNLFPWAEDRWDKNYLDGAFDVLGFDYVSTDVYPYRLETTEDYYMKSVAAAGESARQHGGDFWLFLQTISFIGHRVPELEGLRQQAYVGLANGANKLFHFSYTFPWGQEGDVYPVKTDGTKTYMYDVSQKINRELSYLAPTYDKYENIGIFTVSGTKKEDPPFMKKAFYGISGENLYLNSVTADESLLVGKFDEKTGSKKAFVFVNTSELYGNKAKNTVTFKAAADEITLIYEEKKETLYPDENGLYKITLNPGDGVFMKMEPNLSEEEKALAKEVDEARVILKDAYFNIEAEGTAEFYMSEPYAALKENAEKLDKALINGDKNEIKAIVTAVKAAGKNAKTQLRHYKEQAEPYLTLREELDGSLFEEKSYNAFVKMTDNLKEKCQTEDIKDYFGIKSYLNYAKNITKKLVFTGLSGDCDRDGKITLNDGMKLVMIVAKKDVLTANLSYIGDMNKSKTVTLDDAMLIVMKVAKK